MAPRTSIHALALQLALGADRLYHRLLDGHPHPKKPEVEIVSKIPPITRERPPDSLDSIDKFEQMMPTHH